MEVQSTNRSVVDRREEGINRSVVDKEMRDYPRPLLDIEQRGPINDILTENYNYILNYVAAANATREKNKTLDQTLLVWEFINGEGTLPNRIREGTNPGGPISSNAQPVIRGEGTNPGGPISSNAQPVIRGGRKSRKSKKSSRRNRH